MQKIFCDRCKVEIITLTRFRPMGYDLCEKCDEEYSKLLASFEESKQKVIQNFMEGK